LLETGDVMITPLPRELWPLILIETQEPQISRVCRFFKEFYEREDTTYTRVSKKLKERGLNILDPKLPIKQQLTNAKIILLKRLVDCREDVTYQTVKKLEPLPYLGFLKLLREEDAINLIKIFKKIPFDAKPDFSALKLEEQAHRIRAFFESNKEKLAQLQTLDLERIDITAVPKELDLFTGLQLVDLTVNSIGFIPPSFGKTWDKLKECRLSINEMTTLPQGFGDNWKDLTSISIDVCGINCLPSDFGHSWEKLESLNISSNALQELPPHFGDTWRIVKKINLGANKLTAFPDNFGCNWKKISFLTLQGNSLYPEKTKEIKQLLPSLVVLIP